MPLSVRFPIRHFSRFVRKVSSDLEITFYANWRICYHESIGMGELLMLALDKLTLDRFLPLQKMSELVANSYETYRSAKPYPHIIFDNFFDSQILDQVLNEFPGPDAIRWQKFDTGQEIKLASAAEADFGPATRLLMYHLNSITFLEFLTKITGVSNLISDPGFEGGGLHQIVRGGKLGVHADFNKHRSFGLDRRLNVLVYLNKDWKEDYGGYLQLWDHGMRTCEARVLPIFNRLMVFGTTDFTFHGHPDPLQCPVGMTRKSLALYYFTNGRPAEEVTGEHSTLFRARDHKDFKMSVKQRARSVANDLLPPVLSRMLRRFME